MSHNQRYYKRGRHSQGRGNPWDRDGPRSHQSYHSSSSAHENAHSNPHVAHAITTLIGCVVEVSTVSGVVYEGILRAISPNMDVVLSVAHDRSKVPTSENVKKSLELKFSDVIRISTKTESNSTSSNSADIFKTDTEISRSNGPTHGREFEPFTDFEDTSVNLEDESASGWSVEEMFSVNREKFQVTTNFDENMPQYTTELDRDGEGYKDRAARAKLLASEIEGGKSKHGFDDTGTEEELFSSVVRDHKEALPPHPTSCTATHVHTTSQTTSSTLTPHTDDVPSTTDNDKQSDIVTNNQTVPTTTTTEGSPPSVTTVTSSTSDPPSLCKEDSEGQSLSSTGSSKSVEETECKEVDVDKPSTAESAPVEEVAVKVDDIKIVEEVPPVSSETPPITEPTPSTEAPPTSTDDSTDKESEKPAVKKSAFKLNPNAKEFKFSPATSPSFSPAVTSTSATPTTTPAHTITTVSQSSTYNTPSGRRQPYKPRQRTATPTQNVFPTSEYIIQTQPGGFMIPQGGGVGMVRPGQFVAPGGQVLYPAPYQVPAVQQTGVLNTGGVYTPHLQQVVTSGVTGVTHNPQQQILLAPQQLFQQPPLLSQQQGLFQQPGALAGQLQQGGAVMPTAVGLHGNTSQGQSYQQVIYTPPGGQVYVSPQGGLPTQSAVPLHSSVPPQPLISGVNPTHPPVFTPNRGSYPPHPPGQ